MTGSERRTAYARGFFRQAQADFETFRRLSKLDDVPQCHRLHFLQMTCEKLSKTFLIGRRNVEPEVVMRSHAHIETTLRQFAIEVYRRSNIKAPGNRTNVMKSLTHLARQIELLSPSVDDGTQRPENCEYPWEWEVGSGQVLAPRDYSFPNLSLLHHDPIGTLLIQRILPMAFSNELKLLN